MRLINTKTLDLEEFYDAKIPKYAILSHRWEDYEISYQEFVYYRNLDVNSYRTIENSFELSTHAIHESKGFQKIHRFCDLSASHGYQYGWVDTVCIDRSSSAELSEAINAMFDWYVNAGICFAFLSDVVHDSNFEHSQWFTRGWTLQELLAPKQLDFYDSQWNLLFTRDSTAARIHRITGIHEEAISDFGFHRPTMLRSYSIAQRMSWAAKRTTSRAEDMAYCLLGLFDINMSLLYGEGGVKAFRRLQKELVSNSPDETIFGWQSSAKLNHITHGMLADTPASFQDCQSLIPLAQRDHGWSEITARKPYIITNKGLLMQVHLMDGSGQIKRSSFVVPYSFPINCKASRSVPGEPSYPMLINIRKKRGMGSGSTLASSLYYRRRPVGEEPNSGVTGEQLKFDGSTTYRLEEVYISLFSRFSES